MAHLAITVGQKASRSLTLTRAEVDAYARITGDFNPLHFDEQFAAGTRFKRLVVHGGLTAKPVTQLAVRVVRDGGELVLEGECWVYTLRPVGP